MREDLQEALEKMFRRGYIIVWVAKDDSINYNYWNPEQIEQIDWVRESIERLADETE